MRTLTVKVPERLDLRLAALGKRRGTTKSEVVREALETFCEAPGGKAAGSCLDLAGDIAGSLEGPRDLSRNEKHLRGYGQ